MEVGKREKEKGLERQESHKDLKYAEIQVRRAGLQFLMSVPIKTS